jgi:TPR repeat protein
LQLSGHTQLVLSAEFSPDGRRVVTASDDGTARIWDVATGRELIRLDGHTAQVEGAVFSPDGRRIVTGSYDYTARVWDAMTGRQLTRLSGHTAVVSWAGFSPDGRRIVTSSFDKTARIWDAETGRQLMIFRGHTGAVATAAFSPDGARLVTASDDKTARVWDTATGLEILELTGHSRVLTSAAYSLDGRRIVTSSNDRTARVWDAVTGQQLLAAPHSEQVETAAFSPDGLRVVTASDDMNAHVWDVQVQPLDTQIRWAQAAQLDDLAGSDRSQLGLPIPADVRQWSSDRTKCDEAAAAPYDPDRRAQGAMLDEVVPDIANAACAERPGAASDSRSMYQRGRSDWASGKSAAAKLEFEQALAGGYRAAAIDLAKLLTMPSSATPDVPRAVALYQQAWKEGVKVAAFELGRLYEYGVSRAGHEGESLLAPDESRAWLWYRKAADAGEPNALARFAERDDAAALAEQSAVKKRSLWLASFKNYAGAAERARIEDWPDQVWRNWRYRRASLARLLASEGMMRETAEAFDGVRIQNAASPTMWGRLTSRISTNW